MTTGHGYLNNKPSSRFFSRDPWPENVVPVAAAQKLELLGTKKKCL
jgi:hypothetical protein